MGGAFSVVSATPVEIVGSSAHGRAMVTRLQMNHPNLISIRHLLAALGISWKTGV